MPQQSPDWAAIQAKLATLQGQTYWRSLEELANTKAFQAFLHREFPQQASEWTASMSRRGFLKLMGASLALAGLSACAGDPPEKIVPYVRTPEETLPGKPSFFATAMTLGGYATGLLGQNTLNRPTKLEGNPDHPASLGATDCFAQASILTLYDPDRAKSTIQAGQPADWETFLSELQSRLAQQQSSGGAGLRILTESVTSPTLTRQLETILAEFPAATWHQYEPLNRDNVYAGAELAFGEPLEPIYHLVQADVILCLDADLLATTPGAVRYAHDFAARRRINLNPADPDTLNRLYVIESTPTITGAMADHRLPLKPSQIEGVARTLALALGLDVPAGPEAGLESLPANWIDTLVTDLQGQPNRSLVIVGEGQPPVVHALAHAINEALGNRNQTVNYIPPVLANPASQTDSLRELTTAMTAGQVEMLLILEGNPVFNAPADLDFAAALTQVDFSVHLGLYQDETSAHCQWHVAESHYLESWGDARAFDRTVSLIQPLIGPLYETHSAHELLAALLNQTDLSDYEMVRETWEAQATTADFDTFWKKSLHDGLIAGSGASPQAVTLQAEALTQPPTPLLDEGLEIIFRADPAVWDGRFANNGWLQELPKPLTKLTWDNAALLSPLTADRLGVANHDLVELSYQGRSLRLSVWLVPGHPVDAVTIHLGYGRTQAGQVGNGVGANAYALRTGDAPWFAAGLNLQPTGEQYPLAGTQSHHAMDGRDLLRVGTLAQFEAEPDFAQAPDAHGEEISLYPKFEYNDNAWGMVVDLNACTGCNACVVACQAENNIPIVGKGEVLNGREMHWLRIDHYFEGDLLNPETHHQPVMCMHCENAPCEVVCPVAATLHDSEGLNVMVYNRCIGTRYCSNNCPYKVRRFNFLEYNDFDSESLKLQRNPNVSVRARGVMEKCTYCTQRISAARITAKQEGREIRDGEVVTACQAACPTQAIVFGNLNDPQSRVAAGKQSPLNYSLLAEINTHPRTTYLAKVKNPNPALEENPLEGQG